MGAMADALMAYAQPLLDQTDGSTEQMNKALSITQLCYNLALLPAEERDATLSQMQQTLQMDDEEFAEFRQVIILPMIQRHEDMFPMLHQRASGGFSPFSSSPPPPPPAPSSKPARHEKYPGTDRYAPCPCGSGEKYKFCCGSKRG